MLLKNATLLTLSPFLIEKSDLRIEGGAIKERKKSILPAEGEEIVDLSGKYILPGFVNAHTHLYSSLARGMAPPKKTLQNFLQILQSIWWKLDRALDDESVYYSALAGALEAIQCGTTTLVDHHASPKAIKGSLDLVKQAMEEIGIRGVTCYEVTDRGGKRERDAGLKENERFILANKNNPVYRGMVGAHASFTLGDESLRLLGEMAERTGTGVHIHVAEDKGDVIDAEENYRCGVIERLERHNILRSDSLFAHCIHLGKREIAIARNKSVWFAHNPRSNMNNVVGHAPVHLLGERVALGTDGFPADMLEEARAGFFKNQDTLFGMSNAERSGARNVNIAGLLQGGQRLASELFGREFGTLRKGSVADLVVLEYLPPTPMANETLGSHVLFGMRSSMVESVMVNGKWIVWNRELPGIDVRAIMEKSAKVAKKLWKKMEK